MCTSIILTLHVVAEAQRGPVTCLESRGKRVAELELKPMFSFVLLPPGSLPVLDPSGLGSPGPWDVWVAFVSAQ